MKTKRISEVPVLEQATEKTNLLVEENGATSRIPVVAVNPNINPNRHAEYFAITEDGVLSLKPEYRGANTSTKYPEGISDNGAGAAGSKNAELPACLVIPEVVNGIAVDSIAKGAFIYNSAIQSIVFPKTVKEISEACFGAAANLKVICNTEGVTSIGSSAFMNSGIKSATFPNLQTLGSRAFVQCTDLIHVNVGKITEIQAKTFQKCYDLSRVDSENLITSVGDTAFYCASNLVNAKFVKNLTSIGKCAFIGCGLNYDWDTLTECTFGNYATAWQLQYEDSTKFWENCVYTACENPIPTRLSQTDPRWTNEYIGASGIQWKDGCMLFSLMHAYSGLYNIAFATVDEFAEEIEKIAPGHLDSWPGGRLNMMKAYAEPLGLTLTEYSCFNQSNLQALYDALAAGKYAMVTVTGGSDIDGHSILVYGITESGKLMFIDSDYAEFHDHTKARIFKCLYQNQIGRDNLESSSADGSYDDVWFCIVEKTQ